MTAAFTAVGLKASFHSAATPRAKTVLHESHWRSLAERDFFESPLVPQNPASEPNIGIDCRGLVRPAADPATRRSVVPTLLLPNKTPELRAGL